MQGRRSKPLIKAIEEAERFLKKAKEAADQIERGECSMWGSREVSTVKRASLDLHYALVDMRKDFWGERR